MDARNFLELSDAQRTGYQQIWGRFRVKADASPETLKELADLRHRGAQHTGIR